MDPWNSLDSPLTKLSSDLMLRPAYRPSHEHQKEAIGYALGPAYRLCLKNKTNIRKNIGQGRACERRDSQPSTSSKKEFRKVPQSALALPRKRPMA